MTLQVGITFPNIESICSALDCYSVKSSLPYKFKTNKPNKLLVICPTSETSTFSFTISANKYKDGYIHIVKLIYHDSTCPTFTETFKAHGSFLKKFTVLLVEDIAAIRPHDIINHVHSKVGAKTRIWEPGEVEQLTKNVKQRK
ncbi:12182_t:CDS:1 [Gigaspora margarita]|uniref:12182_t:CDS:1 n=1 Tax=Gigaspora margarita TaxID=4874 RepID=A0ABN7WKK2_GIGMA|nr:12182_t:CDS:1 [Gigaspora margarita]